MNKLCISGILTCIFFCCNSTLSAQEKPTPRIAHTLYMKVGLSSFPSAEYGLGYISPDGKLGIEASIALKKYYLHKIGYSKTYSLSYYFKQEKISPYVDLGIVLNRVEMKEILHLNYYYVALPSQVGYRVISKNGMWKFGAGLDLYIKKPIASISYSWSLL